MTVAAILAGKGRDVATTTAAKTVADAVAVLARRKIGALVVVEDGDRIAGIISERDIVRAIAATAGAALTEPVSAIMTKTVVTCSEGETIDSVMSRMTRGRFRHLPVTTGGRLCGHRLDRRRGEGADRAGRARGRGDARLHRYGVRRTFRGMAVSKTRARPGVGALPAGTLR